MLRTITSSWKYNDEVAVHCTGKQIQEELFHHLSSLYAPQYLRLRLLMTVLRSSRARTSSPVKNNMCRPPHFSCPHCFPLLLPLLWFPSCFLTCTAFRFCRGHWMLRRGSWLVSFQSSCQLCRCKIEKKEEEDLRESQFPATFGWFVDRTGCGSIYWLLGWRCLEACRSNSLSSQQHTALHKSLNKTNF